MTCLIYVYISDIPQAVDVVASVQGQLQSPALEPLATPSQAPPDPLFRSNSNGLGTLLVTSPHRKIRVSFCFLTCSCYLHIWSFAQTAQCNGSYVTMAAVLVTDPADVLHAQIRLKHAVAAVSSCCAGIAVHSVVM